MSDLRINDDWESKRDLALMLGAELWMDLPPVYIISHARAGRVATLDSLPVLRHHAHLVVRQQEIGAYENAGHQRMLAIPDGWRNSGIGGGRAVDFCLTHAAQQGHGRIIIIDDDLTSLSILYATGQGDKVSRAYKGLLDLKEQVQFREGLLGLIWMVAEEAMDSDPSVVLASPQNQNANRTIGSSRVRWQRNAGGNPGLLMVWDVERFHELAPEGLDRRFYRHGWDIGAAVQILSRGGSVAKIPAVVGDSWDCETRSVARSTENAPRLRQAEHDALMETPLASYVKTREDVVGRPQWHSLDWRRLVKDGQVSQSDTLWSDPLALDPASLL